MAALNHAMSGRRPITPLTPEEKAYVDQLTEAMLGPTTYWHDRADRAEEALLRLKAVLDAIDEDGTNTKMTTDEVRALIDWREDSDAVPRPGESAQR